MQRLHARNSVCKLALNKFQLLGRLFAHRSSRNLLNEDCEKSSQTALCAVSGIVEDTSLQRRTGLIDKLAHSFQKFTFDTLTISRLSGHSGRLGIKGVGQF